MIFFPSHGPYKDPAVTRRVLDIYDFMNSKVLDLQPCSNCCAAGPCPCIQTSACVLKLVLPTLWVAAAGNCRRALSLVATANPGIMSTRLWPQVARLHTDARMPSAYVYAQVRLKRGCWLHRCCSLTSATTPCCAIGSL